MIMKLLIIALCLVMVTVATSSEKEEVLSLSNYELVETEYPSLDPELVEAPGKNNQKKWYKSYRFGKKKGQ